MGVFHVTGLGFRPGAVTSVFHYLHDRLVRQNPSDSEFFATSGEYDHRNDASPSNRPPGYVQGLVILTTPQISSGNKRKPVLDVVLSEIKGLRKGLVGGTSDGIELCVINSEFQDYDQAFDRALAALKALHPDKKTGKEVWVNLTAGENAKTLALSLASSLTGAVARLYCTGVSNEAEENLAHPVPQCDIGSPRDEFWKDLPVLAMQDQEMRTITLSILEESPAPLDDTRLHNELRGRWPHENPVMELPHFRQFLKPMESQRLIRRTSKNVVTVGPQWPRVKEYFMKARGPFLARSLRQLAENYDWATWETIG